MGPGLKIETKLVVSIYQLVLFSSTLSRYCKNIVKYSFPLKLPTIPTTLISNFTDGCFRRSVHDSSSLPSSRLIDQRERVSHFKTSSVFVD